MNSFNRRLLLQGGLAAGAVASLAACGVSTSSSTAPAPTAAGSTGAPTSSPANTSGGDSAGAITVWIDSNRSPVLSPVAKQFEADTQVKVNLVIKDFGKIADDFITQAPTGKGPDAVICAHDGVGRFVQNGVIAPLELGDASTFQDVAVQAFSYEGKTYGVPYAIENIALLRNTEMVPEAPKTWDDLLKAGEGKGKYKVLVGLDPKASDPYHLYPLQASFGAPVFNQKPDGSYDGSKIAMGGEPGHKFAQFLAQMGKEKVFSLNISGDIAKDQFTKKQSAFFITGPWNMDVIKKAGFTYAIDPIPAAGDKDATPFVGVQGFVMSAKAKNAVATQKFLVEYVGSQKVQEALFKAGNRAPANKAAFETAKSDKDVAAFGAVGAKGVPMPNVPAMGSVWADWGQTQATIIGGKADDPKAAWDKMVQAIQSKIK
ncbi:maltose ABC transporter substrate-binding protein [Aestuariimicrobium sp. p3-SID1156]|uniref:sugar ABC transporter substrate-binding protein n=1 Tax=Aestuariimicrobium sp. p3-SID1156 TaxID=2916038 RepID=UPI00223B4553|nr:maltose ABC transporter substrate-binding protein [Aestuariimicrobium sp. p3-SID1156]MCT1459723.1 maltose ABC transporter substrate-binding protein [Aestuariimicrobium sp. p3-SID1156]